MFVIVLYIETPGHQLLQRGNPLLSYSIVSSRRP